MTHRNVETLIGRLVTDPGLRRRFADGPAAFLDELRSQGYELTHIEVDALTAMDTNALGALADTLDQTAKGASYDGHHRRNRAEPD